MEVGVFYNPRIVYYYAAAAPARNDIIDSPAMIDSGATGNAFLDSHFAHTRRIPLTQLSSPCIAIAFGYFWPKMLQDVAHWTRMTTTYYLPP